ncbi:MAG: dipeptide epimerase [Candidatus Omnitrophica bacterium]|nr:dipeptide epimerase [Candidatus Omnitrophota bacterium]
MRITGVGILPLLLPMRRPFITALGRKEMSRNLLIALRLENKTQGYGEASSSLAWPEETPQAMGALLRKAIPHLLGKEIRRYRSLIREVWEICKEHPTAASAMECALWDAFARSRKVSLWRLLGGRRRSVTTGLTLSAGTADEAAEAARSAGRNGFRKLKVKVTGKDPDEDLRRVIAVHRAAGGAALWIDANQGFDSERAIRFALEVRRRKLPVRLFEQPVPREDLEGLARVAKEGGLPVAADESARSAEETGRLIHRKIVPVINVKLAKCGLSSALWIIGLARSRGVKLMIGCMAESGIGLSHSVALACGTGAFDFIDLDSFLLTQSPPHRNNFRASGERLTIDPACGGTGVEFPLRRTP